jgi:hypothetical protein
MVTSRDIETLCSQGENIARRGTVAKRSSDPVLVHPGMTSQQRAGMNVGGMGHPSDASSSNPLDSATPGKVLAPVKIAPGMRSRTTPGLDDSAHRDLGALILASATHTK